MVLSVIVFRERLTPLSVVTAGALALWEGATWDSGILIWAVGIGWIWFGEVPDLWFLAGSLMIVVPLILIGLQHRRRSPARGFNPDTGKMAPTHSKNRFSDGTAQLAHECRE